MIAAKQEATVKTVLDNTSEWLVFNAVMERAYA
jgi:hypothetical protein